MNFSQENNKSITNLLKKIFPAVLIFFIIFISAEIRSVRSQGQEQDRISKFGEYKGYSEEKYDSWVRTSQYLTMRDGIKLAADIIRPAIDGKVEEKPLPVIWTHTRYRRAVIREGNVRSNADLAVPQIFLRNGYVLVTVDVRGSGASYGSWHGIFTQEETQDAFEITEWLASQPWCNGNIGMSGGSYLGITQLMAASTKPPHLKAIFPMVALFDLYTLAYHGGIFFNDFIKTWSDLTKLLDTQAIAAPVDDDEDNRMLNEAIEQHRSNRSLIDILSPLKFRDDRDEFTGAKPYEEWHPAGYVNEINQSGIPIYHWCGWFDSFTRDGFLMYQNFSTPKKMVIGAWPHSPSDAKTAEEEMKLFAVEMLRWFDYWLKDIDNGIMDEEPIFYQKIKSPKDHEWRATQQWPLSEEKATNFYFNSGPSTSVKSTNDGILRLEAPPGQQGQDNYTVDYSTTSGHSTRWDNAVGEGFGYPDMISNDEKALTYTTEPLLEDTEITGHPVVHMWISSTAKDGDFFVFLEEVDTNGKSHYVTEGCLRASHRKIFDPPYDNLGLPYHRSNEADMVDLPPGQPIELSFDLQPTSNLFESGNRIRITITCADKDNALTPELSPPPTVSVYRNSDHASYVILPIIPTEEEKEFATFLIYLFILLVIILTIAFTLYVRGRTKK